METKTKHTSQLWDPHILSYGWWKHKNQTAPKIPYNEEDDDGFEILFFPLLH